jgi:hypothetical protein
MSRISGALFSVAAAAAVACLSVTHEAGAADATTCAANAERAQSLREAKKLTEAQKALLLCSNAACPTFVRTDCLRWFDEVQRAMPTIVVRAVAADGTDVLDGSVILDGARQSLGVTVPVNPGPHTINVTTLAGEGEQRVLAAEGEKNRVVVVHVSPARQAAAAPPGASAREPGPPAPSPGDSPSAPWPYILGGIGIASLATFGVLQLTAQAKYDDLKGSCGKACTEDQVQPVRVQVAGSALALGIGIVALATGALLWINARPQRGARVQMPSTLLGPLRF